MNLYWLQCGACGGDTMSLLGSESPCLTDLLAELDIRLLWHPSLSALTVGEKRALDERILAGEQPLDLLVVEGAVLTGPDGTGLFDAPQGRPRMYLVEALAARSRHVVAAGTCAAFGGVGGDGALGLQFHGKERGGFLGAEFRGGGGLPVVNLAGCPLHVETMVGTLTALAAGAPLDLDAFQRPRDWFEIMVHQGCTRNEYHEYRVEEESFGHKGCLFFHMGCHGPLAGGPCNKFLWNQRSSKPRAGVPCFGCTEATFPPPYPFFQTRNIEGIPLALPNGVSRAHYMAYKGMAAAAAPGRLKRRETGI